MTATAQEAHAVPRASTGQSGSSAALVIGVGLVAGLLCAVAGPDPLGSAPSSAVLVTLAVATVCAIGARAQRNLLAWAVLIAGATSLWIPTIVVGFVVFVLVHVSDLRAQSNVDAEVEPRHELVVNALLVGVALNLAARSAVSGVLGLSTVFAVGIATVIVVAGVLGSGRVFRRNVAFGALGVLVAAVAATAGFGAVSSTVADELRQGDRLVREGLRHLGDADLDEAVVALRSANQEFAKVEDRLSSPIVGLSAAVPVVAQHREVALTLSTEAREVTALVSDLLDDVGPDALTFSGARIDVELVEAFTASLEGIRDSLAGLGLELDRVSSPWLVSPVVARLDDLSTEVAEQSARAANTIDVLATLPTMLGADGERVYLVVFTTPAEARGLGGFTGNWAEITVDNGEISVAEFGRSDELDRAAAAGERTVTGPADWLERYGRYGFTSGPGGTVGAMPFKNVTMSPFMSSTGPVIAELYAQSGGRPVDGVFAADVYVIAELLRFSGPVDVADRTLTHENAAQFLLNTQYSVTDKGDRIDLIEEASEIVVGRLLGGARLEPGELLRSLGPLVDQGRLAGWAAQPGEQDILEQVGIAGTLLPRSTDEPGTDDAGTDEPSTDDAVTVALNNAAGSKIDYFLNTSGRYEATIDARAGTVEGVFEVTLENEVPTTPQPPYVVGNLIGEPEGTNRTYVSLYTALAPSAMTVDGEALVMESGMEGGYHVSSVVVVIPPGEQRTVSLRVSGSFDAGDGYSVLVRSPPTVGSAPMQVELAVDDGTGSEIVSHTLETAGVTRIDVPFSSPQQP